MGHPSNIMFWFLVLVCFQQILIIIGSVFAFLIILTSKSLRKVFNYCVLALLFVSHVSASICKIGRSLSKYHGLDQKIFDNLSSIFTALVISFCILFSVDKFITVKWPFLSSSIKKWYKIVGLVIAVLTSIIFPVVKYFSQIVYIVAVILTNTGGVLTVIGNIYLYQSVKRQCERIATTIVVTENIQQQIRQRKDTRKRSLKSFKMCLLIAGSYIITFFPGTMILYVYGVTLKSKTQIKDDEELLFWQLLIMFVITLNGISDVIIFFTYNSKAKRKIKKILGFVRCSYSRVHPL
eukprot:TCONS_00002535-protein